LEAPPLHHVRWTIDHGSSLLELRGDGSCLALLFQGDPCVVLWDDSPPAVERHYLRAYDTTALNELLRDFAPIHRGLDDDLPLRHQMEPLLRLLAPGTYTAEYEPCSPGIGLGGSPEPPLARQLIDWAGMECTQTDDHILLSTVPREAVDPARVQRAIRQIQQGREPVAVFLGASTPDVAFLVLGHAVMEAYQRLNMNPAVIYLEPTAVGDLSADEGARHIARAFERHAMLTQAHFRATRATSRSLPDNVA